MNEVKQTEEKKITVSPEDDGQRLDRWLKKCVPEIPYGLAQKLIRKGAIKIDGKKGKGDSRLAAGQEIRIPSVEDRPDRARPEYKMNADDAAYMRSIVLFDDGDIVVLNKPSGISTQGGGDERRHIDGMLKALTNRDGLKPRLVHRLDKETSGLLLLAREPETVRNLGFTFKTRDVKKIYLALCSPAPEPNEGQVRAPVAKVRKGRIKDKMTIDDEDGKGAVTDFYVIERAGKKAAFVAFCPLTGRTHQIRVHAAEALHAPLIGDDKYARKANADTRITLDGLDLAPRLHLHAFTLVLPDPRDGRKTLSFTAPLPQELRASWQALGFDPSWSGDPFPDKPE